MHQGALAGTGGPSKNVFSRDQRDPQNLDDLVLADQSQLDRLEHFAAKTSGQAYPIVVQVITPGIKVLLTSGQ